MGWNMSLENLWKDKSKTSETEKRNLEKENKEMNFSKREEENLE